MAEMEEMQQEKEDQLIQKILKRFPVENNELVGLRDKYDQLITTLKSNTPTSVLVVGGSGKGKTEVIRQFIREREKHQMGQVKVWQTTAAQLIHRLTAMGSWEDYLAQLCNELRATGDILYFPNLADLFEVGQYVGNNLSVADYLRDYISRGDIVVLTECTPEQASRIELRAPGFLALFSEIRLPELERDQLEKIVVKKSKFLAKKHQLKADDDAALEILRLQQWFTPYSGLPGKTLVFLDSLFSEKKKTDDLAVKKADIYHAFSQETGLPEFMINDQLPLIYDDVNGFFQKNIYGQKEAIDIVLELLFSIKAAVIKRGKPLASLLFVGPTGVGKTEMAKVLAQFLFGNREKMIRFDMSEYADLQAVMRLTGDTGGEGLLTGTVRQNPFSVILFDELEKVHSSFYDLLLQILGEGRLTDSRGRVADFCSTIIIMTSNIGARAFQTGGIGFSETETSESDASQHFRTAVQTHFRPELFNRLDRIIAFAPLQKAVIRLIVNRELEQLKKREGFEGRDLKFELEEEVRDFLGTRGYNARYGARFLQRTLREKLIIPLSHQLNLFEYQTPLLVKGYMKEDELVFDIQKRKEVPLLESMLSADTDLRIGEFVERVTAARRLIHQVMEATLYSRVLSQLDQLERNLKYLKKRKKESEFWQNSVQSKQYMDLQELKAKMERAIKDIEQIELDNFLLIHDANIEPQVQLEKFIPWEKAFTLLKTQLIQLESETYATCSLAIYGAAGSLFELANLYEEIAKRKAFEVKPYTIWFDSQPKDEEQKYIRKKGLNHSMPDHFYLIGVEMEIKGPLSFFYLQGEEGFQKYVNKKRVPMSYFVALQKGPLQDYDTPEGVHRQKFFSQQNYRRTYHPTEGLQDTHYRVTLPGKHFDKNLFALLEEKFEQKLNQYLIS
jgi:ATP-dependent Clp protease ATP-binding subunit ClpA